MTELGRYVVYVVERDDDRRGGTYHRPAYRSHAQLTRCGKLLSGPTLMQQSWAEHTGARPCPECYSDRLEAS